MSKLNALFVSILLTITLVPRDSEAGFFSDPFGPMISMMNTMSQTMLSMSAQMSHTMLELSDNIGDMSEQIGVMADRIVVTEELMAETLVILRQGQSAGGEVLLLTPGNNTEAARGTAPTLNLSNGASRFLIFASNSPAFFPDDRLALLVENDSDLNEAWAQIVAYAGNEVFIAVKSVEPQLSARSNSVRLVLVD